MFTSKQYEPFRNKMHWEYKTHKTVTVSLSTFSQLHSLEYHFEQIRVLSSVSFCWTALLVRILQYSTIHSLPHDLSGSMDPVLSPTWINFLNLGNPLWSPACNPVLSRTVTLVLRRLTGPKAEWFSQWNSSRINEKRDHT